MLSTWWAFVPLVIAGGLLVRWGLWGDPPRGRRRCPRCWYDMRGIGLRCPECGFVASAENQLLRHRRRWRAAFVGLVVLGAGLVGPIAPAVCSWIAAALRPRWVVEERLLLHGCTASVIRNDSGSGPCRVLEIRSKNCLLFRMSGWWFELHPPTDLTGDGVPDLHVRRSWGNCGWPRGIDYIFDLTINEVADDGITGPCAQLEDGEFKDVDGDGRAEYVMADYAFLSVWSLATSTSPVGSVVLRLGDSGYEFAADLMRKRPPVDATLGSGAALSGLEPESWSGRIAPVAHMMVELIYSGNEARAWQLFEEKWPLFEERDHDKFVAEFQEHFKSSPYYHQIRALSAPRE